MRVVRRRAAPRRVLRWAAPLAMLLVVTLALAACGRKGPPQPPGPPDRVIYPRSYPAR